MKDYKIRYCYRIKLTTVDRRTQTCTFDHDEFYWTSNSRCISYILRELDKYYIPNDEMFNKLTEFKLLNTVLIPNRDPNDWDAVYEQ